MLPFTSRRSVFYCLLDMVRGGLPWRAAKEDRPTCEALKAYYVAHPDELTSGLPGAQYLEQALRHLIGAWPIDSRWSYNNILLVLVSL